MIDGLYSAANGMIAQQGRIDAVSNDLANVNTHGYKTQRYMFRDLLYTKQGNHRALGRDSEVGAGAEGVSYGRDFTQGALQRTDRAFDVALQGPGFFTVRDKAGRTALTRDGSFDIDAQGRLQTSTGQRIVPDVRIPAGVSTDKISIGQDGSIRRNDTKQTIGKLNVVTVDDTDQLQSLGDNLYLPTTASGQPRALTGARVTQGSLEMSNTDVAQSTTDLIESQRAYELSSRAVRTWDEMMQTATQIRR